MNRSPSLRAKLVMAQVAVVALVVVTGLVAVRWLTPVFFERGIQNRGGQVESAGRGGGVGRGQTGGGQSFTVSAEIQEAYNDALTRAAIIAGLAGLLAALLVGLLLSRRLLKQLREVRAGAQRLATGDYRQQIPVPAEREVADLATAVNSLAATLADTEEARARLMSDVAHEIRNPLTTIEGYMEGLIDGVLPPTADTFTEVANEALRLQRITEDLSFMSRAQEGAVAYETQKVDIADLARQVVKRLHHRFDDADVDLVVEIDSPLVVEVDPLRLGQALTNIIDNALAHTPAGGTVVVAGRVLADDCQLSVGDTGDGIPPEQLEVIFERFTRFRDGAGIGIGLNIARSIVEGHNGHLTATSDGPGRGATFTMTLPSAAS